MKISTRKKAGLAVGVGIAAIGLVVAGLVLKRAAARKRTPSGVIAPDLAEAMARMDSEGGSMQPVAVH